MTNIHQSAHSKRVYVVTPGGTRARGGIGRLAKYICREWTDPGFTLDILDTYGPGPKALMPFYFAAAFTRLITNGALGRVDLLHVNMSERLSVLRKGLVVHVGHALGIPVVLHIHGAEFVEYCRGLSDQRQRRIAHMVSKAQTIVVLGNYWRSFLVDQLEVPPEKVIILHNGVPGPVTVPKRPDDRACRLLFLGVVCARKGIETLIEALPRLAGAVRPWHLTIAGHGDLNACRRKIERLGLSDRVTFAGWVDEQGARRLLAESDVLVLPSRNEGLPLAILEGMSYGLPIVSTPVGSITDAVADGEEGHLVPVSDPVALAAALQSLVEDPVRRKRLGHQARRRYEESFELSSFNTRLAGIFEGVLSEEPPRSTVRPAAGPRPARRDRSSSSKAIGAG